MRDYDPTTGRYIQADPLGLVDGASFYGYALGNPLRWTDPTGEFIPALMAAAAFAGRPYLWGALSDWLFDDGCYTFDEYLRDLALFLALGPLGKAVAGKIIGALGRAAGNIPPGAIKTAANGTDNVATGAAARAAASRGWRLGDDVYKQTARGKPPSWNTVRARYWKNEAYAAGASGRYTPGDLARMRRGSAPQRMNPDAPGGRESTELSHEPIPAGDGGTAFVPRWPQDHALVDPYRSPGY